MFEELCQIVEEVVEIYRQDGKPLPPATAGATLIRADRDVA